MNSATTNQTSSSRNRWVRLGIQTAFGLALLWLWVRTVSLSDVAAHIRVQRWWVLPLMVLIFVITSVMRARRWQWLLRSLAPVGMVRAFAMNAAGGLLNYVLPIRSGDAARFHGKTLVIATGLVQRVVTDQPRPFEVDAVEACTNQ